MLDDYFSGFRMRFCTNSYTTDWINLEIGITISPILFIMAMEVILKAAEDNSDLGNLGGGCYMSPLKAFKDSTTIICSKKDETRQMLERLDVLMAWYRMKFKLKKSHSFLVRKSKIFTVANQQIPTDSQDLIKSLGRWYDSSMKRGLETVDIATEGLQAINRGYIESVLPTGHANSEAPLTTLGLWNLLNNS